jgi:DNA-binding GntR family transcriptional regulator
MDMIQGVEDVSKSKDAKEAVYFHLKEMITRRELLPNQRLDIIHLSKLLNVSRTPVRDAIQMLVADGFIAIAPRKGTYIVGIDKNHLIELYQYRLMVELFCLEQGFPQLQLELSHLEETAAKWEQEVSHDTYDGNQVMNQDEAFHKIIVQSAGNSKIITSYDKLNSHFQIARSYLNVERVRYSLNEHKEIIETIKEGNVTSARLQLKEHLDHALDYLLVMLKMVKLF